MNKQEQLLIHSTKDLIQAAGQDPDDTNFKGTPERVMRMWKEFFNLPQPKLTDFQLKEREGIVIVKDHLTWGFCPHHILPVEYHVTIGYLPRKKLALGLSKPARIADWVCSQFPLQEEIAPRVCDLIEKAVEPMGVGCVVRGIHMCTRMRGVKSPCAEAITDCLKGGFLHETRMREEFFRLGGF